MSVLAGKRVVATGAKSGRREAAKVRAREGARVGVLGFVDALAAAQVADEIGCVALALPADLTDEQVDAAVERVVTVRAGSAA